MTALRLCLLVVACFNAFPARAADILLDEPVRLRDVVCFPSRGDPSRFFYVPLRARLARNESGAPKFSFVRWVRNVESEAGEEDVDEGLGGGIVHAVVQLGLTEAEVTAARAELASRRPGARLEGPVIFDSGTFALITSFRPENEEWVRSLVGVGQAPVIEGSRAAVSLALTKQGAQVLWESFQTATPDVSFLFSMALDGYRSPVEATLEADFEEIYQHRSFQQKLDLAAMAEVGAAVPVDEAVAGIALASGVPIPPGLLPNLDVGVKARAGGYFQSEVDKVFDDLRTKGAIRIQYVGNDEVLNRAIEAAYTKLRDVIFAPAPRIAGVPETAARGAEGGAEKAIAGALTGGAVPNLASAARTGGAKEATAPDVKPRAGKCSGFDSSPTQGLAQLTLAVEACLTLKYQFKDTKQTGTYRLDLRKFTASTLQVPFAENIGDLRQYLADAAIFRSVNLDDPFYKQREISTALNGIELADFGDVLSSVVVQLRKQHEGGAETLDEVKIDRAGFARRGGDFELLYGWNGDTDRERWFTYEYRVRWSFPGAAPLEGDWRPASFGVIDLDPPYRRRVLELDGDAAALRARDVRSITARIYTTLGGVERVKQVSLRTSEGELSSRVEVLTPNGGSPYDYEITWRLSGKRTLSSGRQTTTEDLIYVDELPEAQAASAP